MIKVFYRVEFSCNHMLLLVLFLEFLDVKVKKQTHIMQGIFLK